MMAEVCTSLDAPFGNRVPREVQASIKINKERGTYQFVVDIISFVVIKAVLTNARSQGVVCLPMSSTEERAGKGAIKRQRVA